MSDDPLKELDSALSDDLPGALRSAAARYGLKESSNYRTPSRNRAVGGAMNSRHLSDTALDFTGTPDQMKAFYGYAKSTYGDKAGEILHGSGDHRDHVHIGWRGGRTSTSDAALSDLDAALGAGKAAPKPAKPFTWNQGAKGETPRAPAIIKSRTTSVLASPMASDELLHLGRNYQTEAPKVDNQFIESLTPSVPEDRLGKRILPTRKFQAIERTTEERVQKEQARKTAAGVLKDVVSRQAGIPIPQAVVESLADIGGKATEAVGATLAGADTNNPIVRTLSKVAPVVGDTGSAIKRAGQGLMEGGEGLSETAGAPEGVRKELGKEVGALLPALALRNPTAIGLMSYTQAKGRGASESEAIKQGVISGVTVGAMGRAAKVIGEAFPSASIPAAAGRALARSTANTAISLAPTVGERVLAGQSPVPTEQEVKHAAVMGTAFGVMPHGGAGTGSESRTPFKSFYDLNRYIKSLPEEARLEYSKRSFFDPDVRKTNDKWHKAEAGSDLENQAYQEMQSATVDFANRYFGRTGQEVKGNESVRGIRDSGAAPVRPELPDATVGTPETGRNVAPVTETKSALETESVRPVGSPPVAEGQGATSPEQVQPSTAKADLTTTPTSPKSRADGELDADGVGMISSPDGGRLAHVSTADLTPEQVEALGFGQAKAEITHHSQAQPRDVDGTFVEGKPEGYRPKGQVTPEAYQAARERIMARRQAVPEAEVMPETPAEVSPEQPKTVTTIRQRRVPGKIKAEGLTNTIINLGGLRPDTPEGRDFNRYAGREGGRPGMMSRDGLGADDMITALEAEGYFFESPSELLDAVRREQQGHKVYSTAHDYDADAENLIAEHTNRGTIEPQQAGNIRDLTKDPESAALLEKLGLGEYTDEDATNFADRARYVHSLTDADIADILNEAAANRAERRGVEAVGESVEQEDAAERQASEQRGDVNGPISAIARPSEAPRGVRPVRTADQSTGRDTTRNQDAENAFTPTTDTQLTTTADQLSRVAEIYDEIKAQAKESGQSLSSAIEDRINQGALFGDALSESDASLLRQMGKRNRRAPVKEQQQALLETAPTVESQQAAKTEAEARQAEGTANAPLFEGKDTSRLDVWKMPPDELRAELARLEESTSAQYWRFTRSANAPPVSSADLARLADVRNALGIEKAHWQRTKEQAMRVSRMPEAAHRRQVENALREGKPVPAEVLADYPDLQGYGESNRLVTKSEADAARERIKKRRKTERGSGGPSTEELADWLTIGIYHAEAGAREFAAWSKAMVDDLGEWIKPHLQDLHKQVMGEYEPNRTSQPLAQDVSKGPQSRPVPVKESGASELTTGIKNAVTEAERTSRNQSPVEVEGRRTFQDAWDTARGKIDSGEIDPGELAKTLSKKPRALNAEESAALIQDRMKLQNDHATVMAQVDKAISEGNETAQIEARARLKGVEEAIGVNDEAARRTGYEQGLGLAARRMMAAEDYSLARTIQRAKVARGGEVDEATRGKLEKLTAQIAEMDAKLAERESTIAELRANKDIQRGIDEEKRQVRRGARATNKEALGKEWDDLKGEFDKWARKAMGQTNIGIDAEGVKIIGRMAKNRIKAGVNDAAQLVDDLHAVLKDKIEGLTKRDVRDAISGYGVTVEPTRNDLNARLSELKRQMRVVSAIEDVESGKRPARSGFKPAPQSKRVAELKTQLADIMKRHGMRQEPSPEAKANALKKRLETDIAELTRRIKEKDFSQRPSAPKISTPEIEKLKAERAKKKAEYDALKPEAMKAERSNEQKLGAVKSRLQKEINELQGKISRGDYSKPKARSPLAYDAQAESLRSRRDSLKAQVNREINRLERQNRSGTEKAADFFLAFRRAVVLSGVKTIGKLSSAAAGRTITTPVEEVIGAGLGKLPVIRRIAAKAPREGGFSGAAERAALKNQFSGKTVKEMWKVLKTGVSTLDERYGGKEAHDPEFIEIFGRIHGALKIAVKRAEFFRSVEQRSKKTFEEAIARGMTPEEAIAYLKKESTQALIGAKAYEDANRAIFMNDNALVSGYKLLKNYAMNRGIAGRAVGRGMQFMLPVVKVPSNYVVEASNYGIGGLKAIGEVIAAKGIKNLTPDQADYIMRNLKKQTIGTAMLMIGIYARDKIGGYYQKDKDKDQPKEGGLKIFGVEIPKTFLHTPALEMLQFGANIGHLLDKEHEEGKQPSVLGAVTESGKELFAHIPFFDQVARVTESAKDWRGGQKFVGEQVKSLLIPPDVQTVARIADQPEPTTAGTKARQFFGFQNIETNPRKATNIGQHIALGIPGLRSRVPINADIVAGKVKDEIVRLGKADDMEGAGRLAKEAIENGKISANEADALVDRILLTKPQYALKHKSLAEAIEFYNALPAEQQQAKFKDDDGEEKTTLDLLLDKYDRASEESIRGLDMPAIDKGIARIIVANPAKLSQFPPAAQAKLREMAAK